MIISIIGSSSSVSSVVDNLLKRGHSVFVSSCDYVNKPKKGVKVFFADAKEFKSSRRRVGVPYRQKELDAVLVSRTARVILLGSGPRIELAKKNAKGLGRPVANGE